MLFSLTVGKVDAGVAVLLTEDKRLIEFPSILLPPDITSGSIVDVDVSRNFAAENQTTKSFQSLQSQILSAFGSESPSAPILRCRNATQTSIVLEWDSISLATASLRSLSLYRNGNKAGAIPRPLEITSTKISGLAVDTPYNFSLVLKTSAGTYTSEKLTVRTHKMTELHGITVTPGILPREAREELEAILDRIGGRLIEQVRIDTTHFVCTEGRGPLWEKAVDMNIPVVLPEWVKACEGEGRLVGVRSYYLIAESRAKSIGSGPISQRDGGQQGGQQQRPAADRRGSQPAAARSQPIPVTKVTPPTPEMPSTSAAGARAANEREPPSPFTKVDEAEEETSNNIARDKLEDGTVAADGNKVNEGPGKDVENSSEPAVPASETVAAAEATAETSTTDSRVEATSGESQEATAEREPEKQEMFDEVKL